MDKYTREHEQDIQWLSTFELLRTQAEPIVQEVTAAATSDPVSEEALLIALREATKKLPQYLQAMQDIPKPRGKEMGKVRKDFLDGLALYIKGCESHIKWFDTQKPHYLSEWKTLMDNASRKFEGSTERLQVLIAKSRVEEWRQMFVPLYAQAATFIKEITDVAHYALKKRLSEEVALPALRRALENLPTILESMKQTPSPEVPEVQDYHKHVVDALHDHIEGYKAWLQAIETQSQTQYQLYLAYAQSAKAKSQRANQRAVQMMTWLHHEK